MIAPPFQNTQEAIAYGLSLDAAGIDALRAEEGECAAYCEALLRWARLHSADASRADRVLGMAFRHQFLREALEAATGTGGIGDLLRRDPSLTRQP